MKDYEQFKATVKEAVSILSQRGKSVTAKKWTRQSPFQKARYKSEYVFPECWIYASSGGMGIVINGEDYSNSTQIADYITNIL